MAFGSARNFDSMLASSTLVDKVCILQRIEKKESRVLRALLGHGDMFIRLITEEG